MHFSSKLIRLEASPTVFGSDKHMLIYNSLAYSALSLPSLVDKFSMPADHEFL